MLLSIWLFTLSVFARSPELSPEVIIFQTNFGDVAFRLYPKDAPRTSQQILALVNNGKYEGVEVLRVVPDFFIQLWGVDSKLSEIPFEKNGLGHSPRRLSLPTGSSSFTFMLGVAPHLDQKFTVFGEVIGGWDTLQRINKIPRFGDGEIPKYRIVIEKTMTMPASQYKLYHSKPAPVLNEEFNERYKMPEPGSLRPKVKGQTILYSFVLSLVFLFSALLTYRNKKSKMTVGLIMLSIGVLIYGLVELTLLMPVFPVSWVSVGVFALTLLVMRVVVLRKVHF